MAIILTDTQMVLAPRTLRESLVVGSLVVVLFIAIAMAMSSFYLPSMLVKYGSNEDASAKVLFRLDGVNATTVENMLRTFSRDHGFKVTLLHVSPQGGEAMNISIRKDDTGEFTVNNALRENEYICYFFLLGNASVPADVLEDFESRFLKLGAVVVERKVLSSVGEEDDGGANRSAHSTAATGGE